MSNLLITKSDYEAYLKIRTKSLKEYIKIKVPLRIVDHLVQSIGRAFSLLHFEAASFEQRPPLQGLLKHLEGHMDVYYPLETVLPTLDILLNDFFAIIEN